MSATAATSSASASVPVALVVPIRTISALNAREHPMQRARRVKRERWNTAAVLHGHPKPELPCVVTMTRVGPSNGLDSDNLVSSCKGVRDQIAAWLGIDDKSPLVWWMCEQRRGKEWAVEVSIVPREAVEVV